MKDSIDFGSMEIPKLFRKLLIPTVLGMVFSAVFVITDGIFVGQGIGSDALAAVNITAPLFLISTGIGLMFGVGASVVASIHLSQGKLKAARINVTQAVVVSSLFLAGIYGWWMWLRHTPDKGEKPVSGTPSKLLLPMFVVLLVVFVLIGIILETCTDSTVPWWDSFTTALSIIAMWMLAHKYVEQWLAWLVVDAVSCGIYIYKDLYFTSFLYGLYAVIACFGYLKWKQLMNLS